jgi:enoyl-CoA hydratase/carnithine racemase
MRTDTRHFDCTIDQGIARLRLTRPERKNPLTFDSYAELRDWFRDLHYDDSVGAVIFLPNGGNFCSGGDVHEIIGPLTRMNMKELLAFTRMTGDLVKAMVNCGKPVISAIDGVCAGAGAIIAMASDLRIATPAAKTAFLFNRVGLAGCDMGACAILPRIIGQGRASELLYTGRAMSAEEGAAWGFFNRVVAAEALEAEATDLAARIVAGPRFANSMTKTMLAQEWAMSIEMAIEAEAQAQAICMQTGDFHRAYNAFVAKERPVFEGNGDAAGATDFAGKFLGKFLLQEFSRPDRRARP